ncbi:unnamed protein product [Knipowitschia caucasica]
MRVRKRRMTLDLSLVLTLTSVVLTSPVSSGRTGSAALQHWSRPGSLNEWGAWGVWSVCSRSCGGGASVRVRTCVTRSLVARPCSGDSRQYKLCNTKPCPLTALDFRELQCQAFNHRPLLSGSSFTWMPFHSGSSLCELSCLAVGHKFYLNFGKVLDGTSCGNDPGSKCVNGRCLAAGCDLVLGSGLSEDACLVCGGRNQTCVHHQQEHKPTVLGYSEVAQIPAGATNLRVTDNSSNYIVLQNSKSESVINGDWSINDPGQYKAAGSTALYERSQQSESLHLRGPTTEDLHLLVLSTDVGSSISVEYWLPPEQHFLFHGPKSPLGHAPRTISISVETSGPGSRTETLGNTLHATEKPASVSTAKTTRAVTALRPQRRVNRLSKHQTSPLRLKTWPEPDLNLDQVLDHKRCMPCPSVRGRRQRRLQFCSKDFVVRALVRSVRLLGSETRFEVQILESYRNRFPLLPREFVWAQDQCCPLLVTGRQYILMIRLHVNHENTLNRLLVEPSSYCTLYRPKEDAQLRRLQSTCGNRD